MFSSIGSNAKVTPTPVLVFKETTSIPFIVILVMNVPKGTELYSELLT